MRVHVTNLYGMAIDSTAQRAQNEFTNALRPLGINEFGIYYYNAYSEDPTARRARIDGINAAVQAGDIVIFQTPVWMGLEFEKEYVDQLHAYGAKVAIFVQDSIPLMYKANFEWLEPYIQFYNTADLLILPSLAMESRFRKQGLQVKKVVYQELWDRPTEYQPQRATFKRELTFLGNQKRFPFTKDWALSTKLRLFSRTEQAEEENQHVNYAGYVPEEQLLPHLNRGFGLCWSEDTPEEDERIYSTMNASFKLSTYLAAGMPVIANQDISSAQIIQKNGLGLLAESLEEVDHLVQTVSEADYQQMANRVLQFGTLLRQGYMAKRIMVATVQQLLTADKKVAHE